MKSRLDKLETRSDSSLADHAETLVRILGKVDAIFWPTRNPSNLATIHQQRRRYLASGIPWSTGSGDSRQWKSDQRQREAMAAAGLVKLNKTTATLPSVQLTPATEAQVRAMAGVPIPQLCHYLVARLSSPDAEEDRPGGWYAETWLFQRTYQSHATDHAWNDAVEIILPALVAGVIESKPSTIGHLFYRTTGKPWQEPPEATEQYSERLSGIYYDTFHRERPARETVPAADAGEIVIPLSATA